MLLFFTIFCAVLTTGHSCSCLLNTSRIMDQLELYCRYHMVVIGEPLTETEDDGERTYTVRVRHPLLVRSPVYQPLTVTIKTSMSEDTCGQRFDLSNTYVFALNMENLNWRTSSCDPKIQWEMSQSNQLKLRRFVTRCPVAV